MLVLYAGTEYNVVLFYYNFIFHKRKDNIVKIGILYSYIFK